MAAALSRSWCGMCWATKIPQGMIKDIDTIRTELCNILLEFSGPLRVSVDKPTNFEVNGTIEAMQGKQKVQGIYFASVVPKAKDVRLYFFPAYTHAAAFENLSETLAGFKKGKSCFHVKYVNDELLAEIKAMVGTGVKAYQEDGLLAKDS